MELVARRAVVILICLIALFAILALVMWSMSRPGPYEYMLPASMQRSDRERQVEQLVTEIRAWQESARDPAMESAAYDADRLVPLDRLPIVLAIERFILTTGELPGSIEDLVEKELLTTGSLRWAYRVYSRNGTWEVVSQRSNLVVSRGN